MGMCADCTKRPICEQEGTLCPEAETYANQDWFEEQIIEHRPKRSLLSPAQIRIANLVMGGHTRAQIADILKVSPNTIKKQIARMRKKIKDGG